MLTRVAPPTTDDVLSALIESAPVRAVRPLAALAGGLGCEVRDLRPAVAQLIDDGLVEPWATSPSGPAVILSAFTATAHGWRLTAGEPLRWVPVASRGRKDRIERPSWSIAETDTGRRLDGLPDPRAEDPSSAAMASERPAPSRSRPGPGSEPPRPVVWLGVDAYTPGPPLDPSRCPSCRRYRAYLHRARRRASAEGTPYSATPAHCVACEWYTHQHLIPGPVRARVEASWRRHEPRPHPATGLLGGKGHSAAS
jgi:hypothetical protein